MRQIILEFIDTDEENTQCRAHWGNEDKEKATRTENLLAELAKPMIDAIMRVLPQMSEFKLEDVADGETIEEALGKIQLSKDIRKAGE